MQVIPHVAVNWHNQAVCQSLDTLLSLHVPQASWPPSPCWPCLARVLHMPGDDAVSCSSTKQRCCTWR